jgi:hypothetical protein
VSFSDWLQIGRFVARLNELSNACELAKADCAPKPCGDGNVTIADWVQAGRYSAGMDPLVSVCGPARPGLAPGAVGSGAGLDSASASASVGSRTLTVTNMVVGHLRTNCLQILLQAQGDENALGFSLSYEANLLNVVSVNLGADVSNALLNVNRNPLAPGRIGLALALPAGQALAPGLKVVAEVCFSATDGADPISTAITVVDQPIVREVVDVLANTLPTRYQNGTVFISNEAAFDAIAIAAPGQVRLRLIGPPGQLLELQQSSDLIHWESLVELTNPTGVVEYGVPVPASGNQHFYRAVLH